MKNSTPYRKPTSLAVPSAEAICSLTRKSVLECSYCEKKMELKFAKRRDTEYDFLTAATATNLTGVKIKSCQNAKTRI